MAKETAIRVVMTAEEVAQLIGQEAECLDMVNHPKHYTDGPPCPSCGAPIECITITEQLNFNLGNCWKYIWRCDKKGDGLEDLRKALWYLNREITRREAMLVPPPRHPHE